jgi:hypothetical protein
VKSTEYKNPVSYSVAFVSAAFTLAGIADVSAGHISGAVNVIFGLITLAAVT